MRKERQVSKKGKRSDQAPPGYEPFSTNRRNRMPAITGIMCLDNYICSQSSRVGGVELRELAVSQGTGLWFGGALRIEQKGWIDSSNYRG